MSKNGTVQNLEHCFKIASHETDNLVKRLKLQLYSTSVFHTGYAYMCLVVNVELL